MSEYVKLEDVLEIINNLNNSEKSTLNYYDLFAEVESLECIDHIPVASKKVERVIDVDKTMIEKLTKEAENVWEKCTGFDKGCESCLVYLDNCNSSCEDLPYFYTKKEYVKEYIRSKTDEQNNNF